jgi:hypothetical protein
MTTTSTSTRRPSTNAAPNWRTNAACRNADDLEIFFPIGHSPSAIAQEAEAKKFCNQCPVIQQCLQWALDTGQETGVWGGLSEDERRAMKRKVLERLDQPAVDSAEEVDHAAVNRFVQGFAAEIKDADFLAAVQICVGRGMTLADVDRLHMWEERTAENRVNRLRKRYKRAGREFPSLAQPTTRKFSEAEVIAIREKSRAGETDLSLAMSYGVNRETIRSICRGLSYRQFGGPIRSPRKVQHLPGTRQHMCGHGDNSLAARKKHKMGEAA